MIANMLAITGCMELLINWYCYFQSATTTVTVQVTDSNDNNPIFSQPSYDFTVTEEQATGQMFGQVQVGARRSDFYRICSVDYKYQASVFWEVWFIPNSKVHGANMGPIWGRQDPDGPHVGPMNFAIWDMIMHWCPSAHPVIKLLKGKWWKKLFEFSQVPL